MKTTAAAGPHRDISLVYPQARRQQQPTTSSRNRKQQQGFASRVCLASCNAPHTAPHPTTAAATTYHSSSSGMDRRAPSWDKSAFVREPLDRTLCRPRPSGSGENHSAAQDHDRLGQRGPPARGDRSHAGGLSPFWAISPPCLSSCGNFAVRQSSSPGTVDSWACEMATNSNFNNGSDFSRQCPSSFRDTPDSPGGSDSDSDASMDAEVASLTSGRRLGMDHKDASLLLGPRCAVRAGYMPVVTPPSRTREAESVEAFFALLSPTAEQQHCSGSNSSSSVTPSPTDGYSTPAAGHLELGRNAVFSLGGRGDRLPGVSGVVRGEVPMNERGAKRQRFGAASASASSSSATRRCKK